MPKVTEAHLETRRQQIVDAAVVCFAGQGFHQTTMQDICREAELSPGAVYRYFAGKEEIIEAVCEGCGRIDLSAVQAEAQEDGTLGILDRLADAAFGDLDEPESEVRLRLHLQLWSEAMRSPDIRDGLCASSIDLWKSALAQVVSAAQARGEMDPSLDPEAVGRVLLSTWQGMVVQKALEPDLDVGEYVDVVKAMYSGTFWRGGAPAV